MKFIGISTILALYAAPSANAFTTPSFVIQKQSSTSFTKTKMSYLDDISGENEGDVKAKPVDFTNPESLAPKGGPSEYFPEEEEEEQPVSEPEPEPIVMKSEPIQEKKTEEPIPSSLAIVPINSANIQFTSGILGGALGFVLGGPALGLAGAAFTNYLSKMDDGELSEVVTNVSKTAMEIYNYVAKVDKKYEILSNSQKQLEEKLEELKSNPKVDPKVILSLERVLAKTTGKISQINKQYDLLNGAMLVISACGTLVEKGVDTVKQVNEEYKFSESAAQAIKEAKDKAIKKK